MLGDDDVHVLLSKFEGWTFEKADVSPAPEPMNVIRLCAPDGRQSWVALGTTLGVSTGAIIAHELKPGHRLLTRIDAAKRAQSERERADRQAARRAELGSTS